MERETMTIHEDGTLTRDAVQVKARIPEMVRAGYSPDNIASFILRHYFNDDLFTDDYLQMAIGIAVDEALRHHTPEELRSEP